MCVIVFRYLMYTRVNRNKQFLKVYNPLRHKHDSELSILLNISLQQYIMCLYFNHTKKNIGGNSTTIVIVHKVCNNSA